MELIKNKITTTNLKASKYYQFTLDDDFNVPDAKPDVDKIIESRGNVIIEEQETLDGKVRVSGTVCFKILYQSIDGEGKLDSYSGEIAFDETINMDSVKIGDKVDVSAGLEDLYVTLINTRKIEVRGLIGVKLWIISQDSIMGATGISNGSGIECRKEHLPFTNNMVNNKDVFKIKEEFTIPVGKANIKKLLWDNVSFHDVDTKVVDGGVHISGEIEIFVMYLGEDENQPVLYVNESRRFDGIIPCLDVSEGMILDANVNGTQGNITVKEDSDGEARILAVDYGLNVDIRVYDDMEIDILGDMYSATAEIELEKNAFEYENLIVKNNATARVSHRERLKNDGDQIFQVINVAGHVDVDDVTLFDNRVNSQGSVRATVLYITADDSKPYAQTEYVIPFEYQIDTVDLKKDDSVRIDPSLDKIMAVVLSNNEIEIRAEINMNIAVFRRNTAMLITDMKIKPVDMARKAAMPGIVAYTVKEGDSIWSIAKTFYSSLESIRKTNELTSDEVKAGDRLLVVKQ